MAAATNRSRGGDSRGGADRRRRRGRGGFGQAVRTFFGLLLMFILMLVAAGLGVGMYFLRDVAEHLPNPDNLIDYTPGGITEIYATDKDPKTGKFVVLGRVFAQNKQFAPITDIPEVLQNATVAIEDERFYNHPGIDIQGIARALYKDFRSKRVEQGASTITQQLARNVYLNQKRTASRKIKEMMLALQIEKNYSKQQILEMYLNEVSYGGNNYGVKAASETYFGIMPKKLTLAQAALIAGLPKNPNGYFPYRHLDAAIARRNVVLEKMAELGYIKPEQAAAAQKEKVKLQPNIPKTASNFRAPYFTNYVLRQLMDRYGADQVYKGGLKVYTTLNWQMQQAAEKALVTGVRNFKDQGVTEGALVSVEPHTGFIRAMVGGTDFKHNQYNNVIQGRRQPGSSFKVFVYTTAFDMHPNRFSPDEEVNDADKFYGGSAKPYRPGNDGGAYHGWVRARSAFAYSYNAAAVWLANEVGVKNVIDYAHRLGVTSPMEPNLSLALGAYPMTPLEMCSAYSTFANHGSRAHPMSIRAVLDADGVVLENNAPVVDQQVVKESTTAEMSDMMGDVVDHGTAANADGIHDIENARGKTGTTNDFRDAWFIGFTPELTTAVWVCGLRHVPDKHGHLIPKYLPMKHVFGGVASAPIWAAFMKEAVPIQRQAGEPLLPLPDKSVPKVALGAAPKANAPKTDPTPTPESIRSYSNAGYGSRGSSGTARAAATPAPSPSASTPALAAGAPPAESKPSGGDAGSAAAASVGGGLEPASAPDVAAPPVTHAVLPGAGVATPRPTPPTDSKTTTTESSETSILPSARTVSAAATRRTVAPVAPRMVTVELCGETGLLATRWCPETVTRTMAASQVPRGHCRKHKPMPGDG